MKSPLDTPTITAHALGELDPAEERLLKMTFYDPSSAQRLAEECSELREISHKLSGALKAEASQFSLTDEQREEVLRKTAAPYPAGRKPVVASIARKEPISFQKAVLERKKFERRPARLATYLTGAAAAAVIILLGAMPSKETKATVGGAKMVRISTQQDLDERAPKFKMVTPNPEKEAREKETKRSVAGAPQSMMDLSAKPTIPTGQVSSQSTDVPLRAGPRPTVPSRPEIPEVVKAPPAAHGEMQITKKPATGDYSSPKK